MSSSRSESPASVRVMRVVVATTAGPLASDLEQLIASSDPMLETFVVVQGPGMSNWIRREMVRRVGAWGGVEMPFLREFMLSLAARASGLAAPERGRDPLRQLAYQIVGHARRCVAAGVADEGRRALAPFLDPLRRDDGTIDLDALMAQAHRLAECFDRYEMDRPDLIDAWMANRAWVAAGGKMADAERITEAWQRCLWRAVVPGKWASHDLWQAVGKLIAHLKDRGMPGALESLGSVSLFGVSSVPGRALELLAALGRHRSVTVHMLAPTMELQELGVSAREVARRAVQQGTSSEYIREREFRAGGNPLVDSLGRLAQEASVLVGELEDGGAAMVDAVERDAVDSPSLLRCLQDAMDRHLPTASEAPATIDDGSIRFHGVTNATRAAEVAHDEILRAIAEIPGLRQEDVLILSPRPEDHASELEAVFRERSSWASGLVLRPADGPGIDRVGVAMAAQSLLGLTLGDQSMAQLRGFIECGAVLASAGLSASEAEGVLDRMEKARARRFISAADRASALGAASSDPIHTLSWALDRVLAGVVTGDSPAAKAAIGGVLPLPVQFDDARQALVGIGGILDAIGECAMECRGPARGLGGWVDAVIKAFDGTLPGCTAPEFGAARQSIESRLRRLGCAATENDLGDLPWAVACREISLEIRPDSSGLRFATGGVTMARMAPMRSVPFRVVIVMGIQHGEFPRHVARDELDLAAGEPRKGDRKPRDEDQLLVLESLHAAGDRIAFIQRDRDANTGERLDESAVIAEVIEAIAKLAGVPEPDARGALIRSHAPLASSPEAWQDPAMASFDPSAHARAVAHARSRRGGVERAFAAAPAAGAATTEAAESAPWTADALSRAIKLPAREFVDALGLRIVKAEDALSASGELVEVGGLDRWALREACIKGALDGVAEGQLRHLCRQDGLLPHGDAAEPVWRDAWSMAVGISEAVRGACPARTSETRILRYDPDRSDQVVSAWIEHIVASSEDNASACVRVRANGSKGAPSAGMLQPISREQALAIRRDLEALASRARREPLPFMSKLLGKWEQSAGDLPAQRIGKVRAAFENAAPGHAPLADDPFIVCAFRGGDFFEWGDKASTKDEPRSFADLADWVLARMAQTGWDS